ncbi:hypothetical protein [Candidatus Arthromitus sp. SFB-turkey]|uniref:hypothetical protein n=1 Tax=Candidatus Arthromitus sp. SFB-turkey TaxID=1840217 RepID=UPI0007F38289|nr:hypothetical protein [Candidatus Arthromitus sp. SFB-turkey]OAT88906.1 hypothetical protein A6P36_06070 [Candidatus Arthromitus sp. SFB-turkey]HJD00938.1 hypothetical protein [Candidatus Dwaynia gallinarum]
MLHILNTLEREFSKRFIESLNFGIENIENEYFLRVLEVNKSDDCDDINNITFEDHNLRFEDRIFRFFEDIFKLNNNSVFVGNFNINTIENMKILYMLRDLDYRDSIKLINILRSHIREEEAYKVNDFDVFKMFLTLCTREIHFPSFYFNKLDIMVFTHYDLSTLMFFKDENYIHTYMQLAKVNDLNLREKETQIKIKPLIEVL